MIAPRKGGGHMHTGSQLPAANLTSRLAQS